MGDGLRAVIWVRAEGIEPSASDLKGPRSTTELRPQDWYIITGRLLYHLSYAVMIAAGSSPTGSSSWNPASISIAQFVLKKITIA